MRTLEKLPEIKLPKSDQQLPDQQDIPLSIGPKVNNCLDPDFISSYCTPSPGTKVDQLTNHEQYKLHNNFDDLYESCKKQVLAKRDKYQNRIKIQKMFNKLGLSCAKLSSSWD